MTEIGSFCSMYYSREMLDAPSYLYSHDLEWLIPSGESAAWEDGERR
jgi:hypothetical protein